MGCLMWRRHDAEVFGFNRSHPSGGGAGAAAYAPRKSAGPRRHFADEAVGGAHDAQGRHGESHGRNLGDAGRLERIGPGAAPPRYVDAQGSRKDDA